MFHNDCTAFFFYGSQGAGSNNTPEVQLGAGTPTTMQRELKRKRPREQQESPQPPYPVVTNCDGPNYKRRLVKDKLMRRTITDYFKMSTGEHSNMD